MKQLTHGSLFAGIGGFDLGFERAGIKTVWQVEIDPFCRRILERHFPRVRRFEDVRGCSNVNLSTPDIISGGFPCQDISVAGKRSGIDGERSGLWREYHRLICELRPRFVVVENVAALLNRGMGRVIGDLAAAGYDAEWCCISAADLGAPHLRERIWIVAYPVRDGRNGGRCAQRNIFPSQRPTESAEKFWNRWFNRASQAGETLADSNPTRLQGRGEYRANDQDAADQQAGNRPSIGGSSAWHIEPDVGRVAHGIPSRVDRLKGLGNAVVPQIAEWIGRRIVACHEQANGESGRDPVESISGDGL